MYFVLLQLLCTEQKNHHFHLYYSVFLLKTQILISESCSQIHHQRNQVSLRQLFLSFHTSDFHLPKPFFPSILHSLLPHILSPFFLLAALLFLSRILPITSTSTLHSSAFSPSENLRCTWHLDHKILRRFTKQWLCYLSLYALNRSLRCLIGWNIFNETILLFIYDLYLLSVWKQECRPTRKGWFEACSKTCFSVWTQSISYFLKKSDIQKRIFALLISSINDN